MKGKAGWNFWWVAPGYNQAEIAYRRIKLALTPGSFVAFDTPTPRIKTLVGSWIWFKSADNSDALYGEDVYGAVIDEASRTSQDAWHAVRSTVTATRGKIRAIGNVKGRKNWFFNLCRRAQTGAPGMRYTKITADDAVKAGILDQEAIDEARRDFPEHIFRELYYAEASDDAGNPFGLDHINACVIPELAPGPVTAYGIDLAKKQDYFVVIGLNEFGGVASFHRWRGVPWRQSIKKVWEIVGEDTPAMVDSTGVGDPVLEELQYEHGNFYGFHFTATSKQKLMEGLAVSIQSHEITFPDGLIKYELEFFEYQTTPTGIRYAAPQGEHDDCVAALALARQMWTEVAPGQNVMKFYSNTIKKITQTSSEDPINNRPWQSEPAQKKITNDLTDIYEELMAKISPSERKICCACGVLITGPNRISDGELFWHTSCAGMTPRKITMIEEFYE